MFASLLYAMLRFALDLLIIRRKSEAELRSEVLALRHQFGVLERQVGNHGHGNPATMTPTTTRTRSRVWIAAMSTIAAATIRPSAPSPMLARRR